jgi:ribosomal protein S18 acetylase RimI-like enzyme
VKAFRGSDVKIRDLRPEDYDGLVALWEGAGLPCRLHGRDGRERIACEIEGACSVFLAAEENGRLIGAVLGTHDGRKGWVNRLAVLPVHRGRGIGRALVAEVERKLLEKGIEIVTCLIEDWNESSMAFFERIGYAPHRDIVYYSKRRSPDT